MDDIENNQLLFYLSLEEEDIEEIRMKKNKTVSTIYYLCSVAWFALAIMYFKGEDNTSMGITYLSIASVWLCLGTVYTTRQKKVSKTLNYYNENAASFVATTENADISDIRNKFLKMVPTGGYILDYGCGSGRDTLAFKEAGYQVDATDASKELCKIASEKTGIKVKCEGFNELDEKEKYDGIWACASLLHLEKDEIPQVLDLSKKALKPGGVMYLSFKYGDFEGEKNDRYFTDMTEERFAKIVKGIKKLEVAKLWITADVREDREDEKWLSLILRKI